MFTKLSTGQDYPSGISKWIAAGLGVGPCAAKRSCPTPGLVVGPGMSKRINLPSGRWDKPTSVPMVPRAKVEVATRVTPPCPMLRIKTRAISTQTSSHDWMGNLCRPPTSHRGEEPQVVIESMTFENSSMRVEEDEVVQMPQPALEEGGSVTPLTGSVERAEEDGEMVETNPQTVPDSPVPGRPQAIPGPTVLTVLLPDPDPNCPLCGVQVGKVIALGKHFAIRHAEVTVLYECRRCGRTNANSRSISSHVPKCRGVEEITEAARGFTCELCDSQFGTGIGLTQHKRHVHPVERNEERRRAVAPTVKGKRGTKLWSVEETSSLIRLILKYTGQARMNQLIADELGAGKTAEQVRSKRRLLPADLASDGPHNAAMDEEQSSETQATPVVPQSPQNSAVTRLRVAIQRGEDSEGVNEMRAIADLVRDVDRDPGLIESSALDIIQRLGGDRTPSRANDRKERRELKGWERRLSHKRQEYRMHQVMYDRDPAKLAALVLDGAASVECAIPVNHVYETFRDRWEKVGQFQGLGEFRSVGVTDNGEFYHPILAAEVMENLARMNKRSAPGPDGISIQAMLKWDPRGEQLARLYTTWLVHGVIPRSFKKCRTRLLPKGGNADELRDVNGWRPVTIGSHMLRLFSRVLTMRLSRACPLNPRQRGFLTASGGCADNLMTLNGVIRHSRKKGTPLAVVFVDFAKAFDSISHEHILSALEQRNVDQHVIGLIKNSYVDCVTRVGSCGDRTSPIDMKVGVKQGDPMSPLLFNLAMDPLIQALEESDSGLVWEDQKVSTLAFADDLVLLSGSVMGMGRSLRILESFCQLTGLRVQPKKCHGFFLNKGVVNDCQPWEIGGTPLHMIDPGETVRYLGVEVGPQRGIVAPDLAPQLQEWIARIKKAPLKPSQRVRVLNSFAIPRIIYQADHCDVPVTTLATLDGMVRKAVKQWLHLAPSTCNGLLYSRCRDGGLGVTRLSGLIPSIQVRRVHRLAHSDDLWTRTVTARTVSQDEWQRKWRLVGEDPDDIPDLGVEGDPNVEKRSLVLKDWREAENRAWLALEVQGVGAAQFRGDKISNSWLTDPTKVGFRQRHYIAGLALRAGTYPTREFLARGLNKEGAACRRCHARLESCSHILGQCPYVKGSRVRRHHKICDLLGNEAERAGWKATREFRVVTPEGVLRIPDLVCTKGDTVLILDVTIRYEMGVDTLHLAAAEKVAHYEPIASQIAAEVGVSTARVMGFPVGARGKWPSCNNRVLAVLDIDVGRRASFARLVSRRALLYSLDVLRDFLR